MTEDEIAAYTLRMWGIRPRQRTSPQPVDREWDRACEVVAAWRKRSVFEDALREAMAPFDATPEEIDEYNKHWR